MTDVLRCEAIRKTYGGVVALQRIDLQLREGEILGLVGANGAGKSTLIDIIGGEQRPDQGKILLNGRVLKGRPSRRARQGIARTFQHPQVALELTLWENVAVGLGVHQLRSSSRIVATGLRSLLQSGLPGAEAIPSLCDRLGLDHLDRLAEEVSFGELRLVEVARALVQKPRMVMLDEPFPGVGDHGMLGLTEALRVIKDSGCAVLLVDHNVDVVAALVDRIALISDGEIAIDGDVGSCLENEIFRSRYIGVT